MSLSSTPKALHPKAQGKRSAALGWACRGSVLPQRGFIKVSPMPQSLAQIYLHIVFSTKNRRPFLQDKAVRNELHKYLGGTCNNLDCHVLRVGGVADHVHVLCRFGRTIAVADLLKELKRDSSQWVKT